MTLPHIHHLYVSTLENLKELDQLSDRR